MKPQSVPSYSQGALDKPLLAMTIGQAFDQTAARYPDGEALVVRHQQQRYNWAQLAQAVDLHARAFLALGMQAGDRLGVWAPNCAEWFICQFASAKIGVILVNINPAYRLSELEYVLKQSKCQWLVSASTFKTSNYHAMLQELLPELQGQAAGQLNSERFEDLRGVIARRVLALAATGHIGQRCCSAATLRTTGQPSARPAGEHSIHLWYHGLPQRGDAQPPQYS